MNSNLKSDVKRTTRTTKKAGKRTAEKHTCSAQGDIVLQLEAFAAIIVDVYISAYYEKQKATP